MEKYFNTIFRFKLIRKPKQIIITQICQTKYNQKRKGLKIHLNASDDRGIDIIRNQINQFVNSKTLFGDGMKFVILDEVDYMTKNAQQALRYLIQEYSNNIRFCLICNYISRIDVALQNEFIRLRFCHLPKDDIIKFLSHIVKCENINISHQQIISIQMIFKSDIRSMINYLQSNQYNLYVSNQHKASIPYFSISSLNLSGSLANDSASLGNQNWYTTTSLDSTSSTATSGNLYVGRTFTGSMAEFRSWTYPVSESDIKNHTLNKQSITISGSHPSASFTKLIYHYPLQENYQASDFGLLSGSVVAIQPHTKKINDTLYP